jgi:hypothetical protein
MNGMHGRSDMGTTRRRTACHVGITLMISAFPDYRYWPMATRLLVISGRCDYFIGQGSRHGGSYPTLLLDQCCALS